MDDLYGLSSSSWRERKKAIERLADSPREDLPEALFLVLKENHHDLDALNGAMQLLQVLNTPVLPGLLVLLDSPDMETRTYAALALRFVNSPEIHSRGVPELLRVLAESCQGESMVNLCFNITETLGKLRAGQAVEQILQLARGDNYFLAFAAVQALGEIGDPRAAPDLLALLDNNFLASAAVEALGKLGDPAALVPVARWLQSPEGEVSVGVPALVRLVQGPRRAEEPDPGRIRQALAALLPSGVDKLLQAVPVPAVQRLPEDQVAHLADLARVFGWLLAEPNREDAENLIEALLTLLTYPEAYPAAADALAAGGRASLSRLVGMLKSEEPADRQPVEKQIAAASVLGFTRELNALEVLTESLHSEEVDLVIAVADALGQIGHPETFDALLSQIAHPSPGVRSAVARALRQIPVPQKTERLRQLLEDSRPEAREAVLHVLTAETRQLEDPQQVVPRILAALADPATAVRRAAIEALPYYSDPQIPGALSEAIADQDATVRSTAARALALTPASFALPLLHQALLDPDPWVRMYACRSLGLHAQEESLSYLPALTHDPMPPVRLALVETIAGISARNGRHILDALLEDPLPEVQKAAASVMVASGPIRSSASQDDPL
jgi:HEAT repeat protein